MARRTRDKPYRYVVNVVEDKVDWHVKLDSANFLDVNNILLPTCLSTAWWLAIGWMCGTKFAVNVVTLDLRSSLTLCLPVLL